MDPSASAKANMSTVAESLAQHTISPSKIQISQLKHRLDILACWFGALESAQSALSGKIVVEIGCGQGDMTVALAHAVSSCSSDSQTEAVRVGRVVGLDPAPLTYGAPFTLGQAQSHIRASSLGRYVDWEQVDPLEYLSAIVGSADEADYIVLAHSLFYLPSEAYLADLMRRFAVNASRKGAKRTRLLVAEWGMKAVVPAQEAHVLAVKAQQLAPIEDGNVRLVLDPKDVTALCYKAGWRVSKEQWIECPRLDDGLWEVDAAGTLKKEPGSNVARVIDRMEAARSRAGKVDSMSVWTAVFELEEHH
ncbi:hypothetical protein CAC42_7028 [Sphaceloma murrayae]|uniref:Methyltransferase domain-containing protein n=1 Tax=Sphaceloma murrayae TaxID=2082308 RepID=A0A2K1QQL5_9PEZI|nr:hypothetical protein CAC42_7028 [Sphaceloma murrayae]